MRRAVVLLLLWPGPALLAGTADASPRRHGGAEPPAAHAKARGRASGHAKGQREAERADPCARLSRPRRKACELKAERAEPPEVDHDKPVRGRAASAVVKSKTRREIQPQDLVGGVETPAPGASATPRGGPESVPAAPRRPPAAAPGRAAGGAGRLREVILEDGQSLEDLAARTGVSVADLARLNGVSSVEDVPTGMRLKLPSTGAPPSIGPPSIAPPATAPPSIAAAAAAPPSVTTRLATVFPPASTTVATTAPLAPAAPRGGRSGLASAEPASGPRPYSSLVRQGASPAPAPAPTPVRRGGRTQADALAAYAVASARAPHLADREEARRERFVWPVRAEVVSGFGAHGLGQRNDGVDLAARPGDAVRASAAGEVVYAGKEIAAAGGNLVLLKHADGWVTAYSHLGRVTVAMRQTVEQGQEIAEAADAAGASIHFEVRQPGAGGAKPVDPVSVLPARGGAETGRGV